MVQYNITIRRSRGDATVLLEGRPVGPAGARLTGARREKRKARISWSLVSSLAVHASMAVVLVMTARHTLLPAQPATEAITLMFAPAPAAEPPSERPVPDVVPELPKLDLPLPEPQTPPPEARSTEVTVPEPEPPKAQPPPMPETPPTEPQPSPETTVPKSEPPAPADMLPPPPPSMPRPPPVTPPKPAPHAPLPRPAPRPRPSNAPSLVPAPAQTQPAQSTPTVPSANPSPPPPISPNWQSALGAWLQANKTYPEEARRRGDEGRATVRFTVTREGRVVDFQLLSGTGSAILDAAVERLLRGARLPPFPAGMGQDQVTVTLQIRYALER